MNFEMKELPRQQSDRVRDRRIERVVELVSPAEMLEDLPLGPDREDAVLARRAEVKSVLDRDDDRMLVVVGPCSVHDPEAAVDYVRARRELKLQETLLESMVRQYEVAKLDEAKEGTSPLPPGLNWVETSPAAPLSSTDPLLLPSKPRPVTSW